MLKTYGELNLKEIRELAGLDFAHFTYQPGKCSCCFGPIDLPKQYWNKEYLAKHNVKNPRELHDLFIYDYEYLLFKNAENGTGIVRKNDYILDHTMIEWRFDESKMNLVIGLLQKQLGNSYDVIKPADNSKCIKIKVAKN